MVLGVALDVPIVEWLWTFILTPHDLSNHFVITNLHLEGYLDPNYL